MHSYCALLLPLTATEKSRNPDSPSARDHFDLEGRRAEVARGAVHLHYLVAALSWMLGAPRPSHVTLLPYFTA